MLPVADLERARRSTSCRPAFDLLVGHSAGDDFRVVQLTPPGSACSIALMRNTEAPGTVSGLHLVVADLDAARAELAGRGTGVSEIYPFGVGGQQPGPDPDRRDYSSFVSSPTPTTTAGCSRRSRATGHDPT
ncbi:MAG: hypothetical protein NVSMB13_06090 [Mycobacteriales bacterium]